MEKLTPITAETSLNEHEIRQLLARLSEPSDQHPENRATVQDIAETLDVDVETVIRKLSEMRSRESSVPEQAQKLAVALDELKTKNYRQVTNKPAIRMSIAAFIIVLLFLVGIFYNVGTADRRIAPPNITTMDKKGPAEELSHGP